MTAPASPGCWDSGELQAGAVLFKNPSFQGAKAPPGLSGHGASNFRLVTVWLNLPLRSLSAHRSAPGTGIYLSVNWVGFHFTV